MFIGSKFFKTPLWMCYDDAGGGGTAGGGAGEGSGAGETDGQGAGGEGTGTGEGAGGAQKTVTTGEASAAVQSRIAQLQAKHETETAPLRQLAERISKRSGMTVEQVIQRLDAEDQARAAQQTGLSLQMLQYLQGITGASQQTAAEVKRLQRDLERGTLKADTTYADFDSVAKDVEAYADKYGVSLKEAYWAVNGDKRTQQLAREAEQRAIAQRESMGYLGAVSGDTPIGQGPDKFPNADAAYVAKQMGLDAEEFNALSGEKRSLDDWDKLQEKRNKKR